MTAVRCAARRLGGSLLQRKQAAEGCRLVRSRFMRSRQLSSECAREIQNKKVELRNLVSKAMQKRAELHDVLLKNSDAIGEPEMRLLQHFSVPKAASEPRVPPRTSMGFATRIKCYLEAAVNAAVFAAVTAYVFGVKGDRGVQAQAATKEEKAQ